MKFVGIENYETLNRPVIYAKDLLQGQIGLYEDWIILSTDVGVTAINERGTVYYYERDRLKWEIERILKPGERVVLEA